MFSLYLFLLFYFNAMWMLTYVLVLRRGYLDKAAGIPLVALCLNLAWDFSGAFFVPSPAMQDTINIVFAAFNLAISYHWFLYWRNDHKNLSAWEFFGLWMLAQAAAFAVILYGQAELKDVLLFKMGFIDNFINSALFIVMLYHRPALEGQSFYIGLSKLLGTGAVSLASLLIPYPGLEESVILNPLFFGIFVLDALYCLLFVARARRLGIDWLHRW